MSTTDSSPGKSSPPPKATDRVGQTIRVHIGGREVVVECVGDDGRRLAWKAREGEAAGEWDARLWDINRTRQEDSP